MLQKKILLIEDDMIEGAKLKNAISNELNDFEITSVSNELNDFEITSVNNGREGYAILEKTFLDFIIIDLNKSKANEIDFIKTIKNNQKLKHIPIVILTTAKNSKNIKECYKIGIVGYILKSLDSRDYVTKINTLFKYWSLNEFIFN